MKNNYKAWTINYQEFHDQKTISDQLKFLIRFAVLAPSGHNSQPWKFALENNTLLLSPETSRALAKSDPVDRQLFISLGCALENLLIAADYYNFDTEVEYLPPDRKNVAVKITFTQKKSASVSENHLVFSIPRRHTNRSKYENRALDSRFVEWLKSLQNDDIRLDVIENKSVQEAAADISVRALLDTMDNVNFREELSQYLKSNFTKSKVGMPGFAHGIPGPVSLFASRLIRRVNMNRLSRKQDEAVLKKFTPLFCLISSKKDDKKSWLKTGQLYERIALEAEKSGIKNSPLAAAMENEGFNEELKKLLHLSYRPQVFMRLGYCKKGGRLTPRLLSTEVC